MKICPSCSNRFAGAGWSCAACGFKPKILDGTPILSPEAANEIEGFKSDYFEPLAEMEAGSFWFKSRNRLIQWLLARYFPNAKSLLEIGCGTGFVLTGIADARPGLTLYGSDLYTAGLAFAGKRLKGRATLFQADAKALPFEDEFDVVGTFDMLEHIEDDEAALAGMWNALSVGGGIILTVPQHPFLFSRSDSYALHARRYAARDLKEKLRRAGFEIVSATSFVSLLFPVVVLRRLLDKRSRREFEPCAEHSASGFAGAALERIMDFERWLIRLGVRFPFGASLVVAARKMSDGSKPEKRPG